LAPSAGLKPPARAHNAHMSTPEPGLDLHEWASEYASIEEDIPDDPDNALTQLTDLVGRMLTARGFPPDDDVADDGEEPEILDQYRAAREIERRVDAGLAVEPEDVIDAIEGLKSIYDYLVSERPAP
jgi:hypothetical protein